MTPGLRGEDASGTRPVSPSCSRTRQSIDEQGGLPHRIQMVGPVRTRITHGFLKPSPVIFGSSCRAYRVRHWIDASNYLRFTRFPKNLRNWSGAGSWSERRWLHQSVFTPSTVNAACVYALAMNKLDISAARDRQLRTSCERSATSLLNQALDLVPTSDRAAFWARYVRANPDLRAVRPSPTMVELDRKFSAASR